MVFENISQIYFEAYTNSQYICQINNVGNYFKMKVIQATFKIFTVRKRSLRQGNIFSSMYQEFCSQGRGSASVHAGILPSPPPRAEPPPGTDPLGPRTRDQAPPPDQAPPGPGMPPRGRHPLWSRPPRSRHPPLRTRPPRSRHPLAQCMLGDTVNKWTVCILLECNLV